MKSKYLAVCAVLLGGCVSPQTREALAKIHEYQAAEVAPTDSNFTVEKDKFTGKTTYSTSPYKYKINGDRYKVGISYTENSKIYSVLIHGTSTSGWRYLDFHPVVALCDNQPIDFGETKHDGSIGSGYVLEFISFYIENSMMKRISNCKDFKYRVGIDEVTVPYGDRESWRRLADLQK